MTMPEMFTPPIGWPSTQPPPASEVRPGPASDYWYRPVDSPSEAGVLVTDDKAMAVATFFACVRVLSQAIASMPLLIYRSLGEGAKERARDHTLYPTFHDTPNTWQTAAEWKMLGQAWLLLRGNWYCRILHGLNVKPTLLMPLHPDRVQVQQMPDGTLRYQYRPTDGPPVSYHHEQILHIRGLSLDGVTGVSVLTYARNATGLAAAQESHGSKLFANGSLPPFALETPEPLNERAIANFRAGWRGMHAGSKNAHNPPILQGGMKLHELSLTNEDSQWLESREFQGEEICRFMGVPPHMVGLLKRATFSNIEHQGIEFVRYTLRPWATLWQQAIKRDCLQDEPDIFAEFLLDDLQRGDTPSRYSAYNIGLQGGFLTRNEVRGWENLNPITGGDTPMEPLNMAPIGQRERTPDAPPTNETGDDVPQRAKKRKPKRPAESNLRRSLQPLVDDVTSRVAAAELKGLSTRAGKANEDLDRWREWADEWYDGHIEYVRRALRPLAETWRQCTGRRLALTEMCCDLKADAMRQLRERHPQQVLDEWKEVRAQQTAAWLIGELR